MSDIAGPVFPHRISSRHCSLKPMRPAEAIRAGIFGVLVGDALGVPYEFLKPHQIGEVTWRGGGAHGQPPGTWSDDGALTLALLDSMCGIGFDTTDQARRFLDWADRGAYTPDGDGKFDIGGATASALERLRAGVEPERAGDDPDAQGNGSLMRILPIALVDPPDDADELIERAHRSSAVTHGAPECLVACAVYVLMARAIAAGERDRDQTLSAALDTVVIDYDRRGDPGRRAALERLRTHSRREGRGWVIDSFWSAWDAFASADSYRDAVGRAVRYGLDTDTTAAIAGGLAGLYWSVDGSIGGIPADWLGRLRDKAGVDRVLDRCAGASAVDTVR
jgi:ADP-ribosyl-[dinitrogen reductase] hydrolase